MTEVLGPYFLMRGFRRAGYRARHSWNIIKTLIGDPVPFRKHTLHVRLLAERSNAGLEEGPKAVHRGKA